MKKIEKQIKDTNASYRDISAGDAKNTDLFLDGEFRPFFGRKKNIQVRLHKQNLTQSILFIASILPRKYDCSSIHKKISYSNDFVIENLLKLDGFFEGKSEKIVSWAIRQGTEQKNGKIDERFYLNNLIQEYSYTTKNGSIENAKFTIRDYLAGGYSKIRFVDNDEGYYDFYVYNSTEKQFDNGEGEVEDDFSNESVKNACNRIVFGAPGTGKSFTIKKQSSSFEDQKKTSIDKKEEIRNAITEAVSKSGKLTLLNSIGFKYSDELKDIQRKDLPAYCEYDKIDELYIGANAKPIFDEIQITKDDLLTDIDYIKKLIQSAKGNNNSLKWANAIGFKFGDFLKDWTLDELRKTFELSEPQMWWIYRGAQASQVRSSEIESEITYVERVTFHPNYSYAQFVGTYKPVQDDDDRKQIKYEYVPGPFMRMYRNAKKNPNNDFLLVIEEINRANVAAVFGDVFQLLDRKNGVSEYPVAASEDVRNFLADNGINEKELCIPDNMYIWATMNSADQGVFPMDTAFKRRWKFEYIGIDDNEGGVDACEIPLQKKDDGSHEWISWNQIRHSINDKLTDMKINEDKLLGPYFISEEDLMTVRDRNEVNADEFVKLFKSKVLMYLFEDAAKMKQKSLFKEKIDVDGKTIDVKMRFSSICDAFDKVGQGVFNFD